MSSFLLALMMQYVVATKAGLVNDVKGLTNVKPMQMVEANTPVRTGPTGFAELLLTPGAYLRLGPNAEVVLDTTDLTNVALHIVSGQAIIEVVEMTAETPIRVTTGQTTVNLRDAGIFRFRDGVATVIEGKFETAADTPVSYKKGWEVTHDINYRARKVSIAQNVSAVAGLDSYSDQRSSLMARANVALAPSVNNSAIPLWVYSQVYGLLTYMPIRNTRSPYGYRYAGIGFVYNANSGYTSSTDAGSAGSPRSSSSSSSSGSSGGGSIGSGGGRVFSTPSGGSSSPGGYIGGKSSTTGTSQPPPPQH
jgi:hypothetical protein